jgi:hypothetical protein
MEKAVSRPGRRTKGFNQELVEPKRHDPPFVGGNVGRQTKSRIEKT